MKNPYFGRLLTAMVTPMNADGSVNYTAAGDLAEYLINNGSDGLVVAGSTGEAATLSDEEKLELFKVVAKRVNKRAFVIAGTGTNDTQKSIEITKATKQTGVDGVMLVGPYYNKPTQEGFYQHFNAIAKQTNLPIIVYNVPGRTASNILPQTISRLTKDCPNVVAIKESSGNLDQISELRSLMSDDFTIYSGDDSLTLPIMSVGGNGIISVAGHVVGKQMQQMMQEFLDGDVVKARQIHISLLNFFKTIFITTNPIPVKAITSIVSKIDCGPLRLPLTPISEDDKEKLIKSYENLK